MVSIVLKLVSSGTHQPHTGEEQNTDCLLPANQSDPNAWHKHTVKNSVLAQDKQDDSSERIFGCAWCTVPVKKNKAVIQSAWRDAKWHKYKRLCSYHLSTYSKCLPTNSQLHLHPCIDDELSGERLCGGNPLKKFLLPVTEYKYTTYHYSFFISYIIIVFITLSAMMFLLYQ